MNTYFLVYPFYVPIYSIYTQTLDIGPFSISYINNIESLKPGRGSVNSLFFNLYSVVNCYIGSSCLFKCLVTDYINY